MTASAVTRGELALRFEDGGLQKIINEYTRESGVRNLDREIANVCRKVARRVVEGDKSTIVLTPDRVGEFLGPVRFFRETAALESDAKHREKIEKIAAVLEQKGVGAFAEFDKIIYSKD